MPTLKVVYKNWLIEPIRNPDKINMLEAASIEQLESTSGESNVWKSLVTNKPGSKGRTGEGGGGGGGCPSQHPPPPDPQPVEFRRLCSQESAPYKFLFLSFSSNIEWTARKIKLKKIKICSHNAHTMCRSILPATDYRKSASVFGNYIKLITYLSTCG